MKRTSYQSSSDTRRALYPAALFSTHKLLFASLFASMLVCGVTFGRSDSWTLPNPFASGQPNLPSVDLAQQTPHPAVVQIRAVERGRMAQGSGTLVGINERHGLIVTNWHIIREAKGPVVVTFPDGFQSAATVLAADRDWDLAALLIWRPQVAPVRIATAAPQPGEVLTIAGFGPGRYRAVSGRCTQYVAPGIRMPYEMVEVAAVARQGDSGGPILNQSGELAGVLFGAGGGTTSGSFCGRVEKFLQKVWPAADQRAQEFLVSSPARNPITQWPAEGMIDSTRRESPTSADARNEISAFPVTSFPAASDPTAENRESRSINWNQLAGPTPFDQAKTVLAAIGVLGIFIQVTSLMSGRRE